MYSRLIPAAILFSVTAFADFSYQQVTRTRSAMMNDAATSTVLLKGNRMATITRDTAHIIDLEKETFTDVDMAKRTYSVTTFAEMQAALAKMKSTGMEFRAEVKQTGQKRDISGYSAQEFVVSLMADVAAGPAANMQMDVWTTPTVAGYDEMREFQKRMAAKINWTPGAGMANAKGMAELMKQMSKLDGVPVMQIMRIGVPGAAAALASPDAAQAQAAAMQAQAAQAQAAQAQRQAEQAQGQAVEAAVAQGATRAAMTGALGRDATRAGMIAGSFSGIGFGRKKKQPTAAEQSPAPAAPVAPVPPKAPAPAPSATMEITSEMSGFSSASVDAARLDIPSGYQQVESPMKQLAR